MLPLKSEFKLHSPCNTVVNQLHEYEYKQLVHYTLYFCDDEQLKLNHTKITGKQLN